MYHLTTHSALRQTPLAAWQNNLTCRKQPLRYPPDSEEFFLDFLPAVPRIIQRDGIHFHGIRYWDNVLSPWAGRLKQPLLIKYDPRNLARVYVWDANGRHWPVPYADLRQPPVALWELIEARRRLRLAQSPDLAERAIFANVLLQRRILEEAIMQSKQRRRKERTPQADAIRPAVIEPAKDRDQHVVEPYPVEIWGRD